MEIDSRVRIRVSDRTASASHHGMITVDLYSQYELVHSTASIRKRDVI
jgi:hypothetical protein